MKKLFITLSLLLASQSYAQNFNCKAELERDISIRSNTVNSGLYNSFGSIIKDCATESDDRAINCSLGLGIPAGIAAFSLVPGGQVIVPAFLAITYAIDLGSHDDNGISNYSHKKQLRLSKNLHSVLSGNRRDIWRLKTNLRPYAHAKNNDVLKIVQEMDADGSLCSKRGYSEKSLLITEEGIRELERKSVEVGTTLTWFNLMTFEGVEGVLSEQYVADFISKYTYVKKIKFGQVINKKEFLIKLKAGLKSLGYRPDYSKEKH